MVMIVVRLWNDLVGPGRTVCTSVFLCLPYWRSIRYDVIILPLFHVTVHYHNLTTIPRHYTLPWRWRACIHLG